MQTIPDIALVPAGFRVKEPTLIQYLPRLAVLGSLAIAIIIPAVTNAEPRDHDFHFPIETGEQIPTVLTFYENPDFSGAAYTVEVELGGLEATRVITTDDISSAGLNRKISSVRLTCGTRASRASLFDINWGQSSRGKLLECNPRQTASIDLSTDTLSLDMNDKIGAAAIVAHPSSDLNVPVHSVPVSPLFGAVWKTKMDSLDNATNQGSRIWLADFHTISRRAGAQARLGLLQRARCRVRAAHRAEYGRLSARI